MRKTTVLTAAALGAGLVAAGIFLAPSFAQDRPAGNADRQWLSIPQIHDKLDAAGYRNIEKIEREHGGYEVRATDRNGERIRLYVNPRTGEIGDRRQDGRRHERGDGHGAADGTRSSPDCNERRCRDDLPQKGVAAPAASSAVK